MNDEESINLVEQCPHLYNCSLKSFKDDKLKENSWMSIAEYLKSDAASVKKRWENLRDRFVRAYRDYNYKPLSGFAGGSNKKAVEFVHFQQMIWLGPFLRKRKLTSSIETEEATEETAEEVINFDENTEPVQEIEEEETFEVGSDGILSPTPSIPNRPESSHSQHFTPSFRQEKTKFHETMAKAIDSFTKICEARYQTAPQQKNEGDMNFMKSIVEDMQVLRPSKRFKFKREIMDLLVKYVDDDE